MHLFRILSRVLIIITCLVPICQRLLDPCLPLRKCIKVLSHLLSFDSFIWSPEVSSEQQTELFFFYYHSFLLLLTASPFLPFSSSFSQVGEKKLEMSKLTILAGMWLIKGVVSIICIACLCFNINFRCLNLVKREPIYIQWMTLTIFCLFL